MGPNKLEKQTKWDGGEDPPADRGKILRGFFFLDRKLPASSAVVVAMH